MSELDILIGDRTVALRDERSLVLRPCKVMQLRSILGLVNKYVEKIAENEDAVELAKFLLADSGKEGLNDIFEVLKSCSDLPKDKQQDFFDNLYYDELALLVAKFIEMNRDFFKSMGDIISKVVEPEKPKAPTTGASQSPG